MDTALTTQIDVLPDTSQEIDNTDSQAVVDDVNSTAEIEACSHFQNVAIKAYKTCQDNVSNEARIVEYLPMVRRIVNKISCYADGSLSREDLVSAGTVGLIKAARDFDPSKDADFKTYAYIRVRGAVIDEFRSWTFVPNDASKQIEQARKVAIEIEEQTGRTASDEEIAEKMGVSPEKLMKIYESARNQHFLSINGTNSDGSSLGDNIFNPKNLAIGTEIEKSELIKVMANAISELSEKAKKIIMLYYYKDLTMKEIAKVLGITESRVSQIHASAIFKLSLKMSGENGT